MSDVAMSGSTQLEGDSALDRYESQMGEVRERFFERPLMKAVRSGASPRALHCTFIAYCTHGVAMTESVESWIQRAGERCVDEGYIDLGEALQRHAVHEADHHLMMIEDSGQLIASWNLRYGDAIDRDELLAAPFGQGIDHYIDLHESVIASDHPFAQIAIEFEIEQLSVTAGPLLVGAVASTCGSDVVEMLSFLRDHIEIDAGHTEFNRRQMRAFLATRPDAVDVLVRTGQLALEAYGHFLDDCWAWACERAVQ